MQWRIGWSTWLTGGHGILSENGTTYVRPDSIKIWTTVSTEKHMWNHHKLGTACNPEADKLDGNKNPGLPGFFPVWKKPSSATSCVWWCTWAIDFLIIDSLHNQKMLCFFNTPSGHTNVPPAHSYPWWWPKGLQSCLVRSVSWELSLEVWGWGDLPGQLVAIQVEEATSVPRCLLGIHPTAMTFAGQWERNSQVMHKKERPQKVSY
jgi:hypothetical protein